MKKERQLKADTHKASHSPQKAKRNARSEPGIPASATSNANPAEASDTTVASRRLSLVVPALAALVMRQARVSLIEQRMIAGVDKKYGNPIGLTPEDRNAMALISRACLSLGLPDHGSEIHDLLVNCARPLGAWLPLKEIEEAGLLQTRLINDDYGSPTPEAEELAKGFSTLTAGVEEQLFSKFREELQRHPKTSANQYYTAIREFVVRHPLADGEEIKRFGSELPSMLWLLLQQHFYERVPYSWSINGQVSQCTYCGNAMRETVVGMSCRTIACSESNPPRTTISRPVDELFRVNRGIQQYWVEPGIDEIQLYDALVSRQVKPELYPFMDRVDIAVADIGIDLKAYSSPELLGGKIRNNKGGLTFYEQKWLVVPDWLVANTPQYLDRLRSALEEAASAVRCLSSSEALREITSA